MLRIAIIISCQLLSLGAKLTEKTSVISEGFAVPQQSLLIRRNGIDDYSKYMDRTRVSTYAVQLP